MRSEPVTWITDSVRSDISYSPGDMASFSLPEGLPFNRPPDQTLFSVSRVGKGETGVGYAAAGAGGGSEGTGAWRPDKSSAGGSSGMSDHSSLIPGMGVAVGVGEFRVGVASAKSRDSCGGTGVGTGSPSGIRGLHPAIRITIAHETLVRYVCFIRKCLQCNILS